MEKESISLKFRSGFCTMTQQKSPNARQEFHLLDTNLDPFCRRFCRRRRLSCRGHNAKHEHQAWDGHVGSLEENPARVFVFRFDLLFSNALSTQNHPGKTWKLIWSKSSIVEYLCVVSSLCVAAHLPAMAIRCSAFQERLVSINWKKVGWATCSTLGRSLLSVLQLGPDFLSFLNATRNYT